MSDTRFQFASRNAGSGQTDQFKNRSRGRETLEYFKANKGAVFGAIVVTLLVLLALLGPLFSQYTYDEVVLERQNLPPRIPGIEKLGIFDGTLKGVDQYEMKGFQDSYFLFGTDSMGRDLFTRVCQGMRISLLIAVLAVGIDMVIGVTYGMVSGYLGGKTDMVMQRIIEIIRSIPNLVVVTLLIIVMSPGLGTIVIALTVSGWVNMSRLIRAQTLKLKEQEFVLASRILGESKASILLRDILPNSLGQIIITSMMSIPTAIFMEAFLSFIGLGIPAPQASLGMLISDGYSNMMLYAYQMAIPAAIFALLMISMNLIGDGFRDAFDPKMRQV